MEMTQTKTRRGGLLQAAIDAAKRGDLDPPAPKQPTMSDTEYFAWIDRAREMIAEADDESERRKKEVENREFLRSTLEVLLAKELRDLVKTPGTTRVYRADAQLFRSYCDDIGMEWRPASPEIVACFLFDQSSKGVSIKTLKRYLTAISYMHRVINDSNGYPFPNPTDDLLVAAMVAWIEDHRKLETPKPADKPKEKAN